MRLFTAIPIIILIFSIGCSDGGSVVIPDNGQTSGILDNLPLNGLTNHGESSNALGLLGHYELNVDPNNWQVDLTAKRISALGESYLVSGLSFFTVSPCPNCLKMKGVGLTGDGYLELQFELTHPFIEGDPLKPPSGQNRLDLDIFDVAMIVVPTNQTPNSYSLFNIDAYDGCCMDVDGYTCEIEALVEDDAVYPFYLCVDDTDLEVKTFNEFPMGSSAAFSLILDINEQLTFELYLTFGYGASAAKSTRLEPVYFNPEFNRKNAWKVEVIPPQGDEPPSILNTWNEDDNLTEFSVTVKVWDWQNGVTDISNPPIQSGDIAFASDVSGVMVEIPGMNSILQQITSPVSGSGNVPDDPLIFNIPIANENQLPEGEYLSIVKVADQRIPALNGAPFDIDTLLDVAADSSFNWYDIPEYATYQSFISTVLPVNCTPYELLQTGSFSSIHSEYLDVIRNQTDLESFWAMHDPFGTPPGINFNNDMVIVICLGARNTSGYYASIDCIKFLHDTVDVEYTENIPGVGCMTLPVVTYPFIFVLVPQWVGEDVWHENDYVYPC